MVTKTTPYPVSGGLDATMRRVAWATAWCVISLHTTSSFALGLGRLNVQSALGEPLRAEIDVTAITPQEAASLKPRVAGQDSYRAAGMDYNPVLASSQVTLERRADGRPYLRLTSDRPVNEPFLDAILDVQWASGRLVREYTLLFDPPALAAARPASSDEPALPSPVITSAVMDAPTMPATPAPAAPSNEAAALPQDAAEQPVRTTDPLPTPAEPSERNDAEAATKPVAAPASPAPVAAASPSAAPAVEPRPEVAQPRPATTPVKRPAAPVAKPAATRPASPAPVDASGTALRVKPGDSLSQLAERALVQGVSLDQMMVSLYRGNPQAFIDNNINRLKSGVVLKVPSKEDAQAVSPEQARQVIVAQSTDFETLKQRMATGVTARVAPTQQRQAVGKVEAEVTDQRQVQAPKPDKLTLSKGGLSGGNKPLAVEDRVAQERAKAASETRVAELSRNLDELQKLKEQVSSKPAASAPPPVLAAPSAVTSAPSQKDDLDALDDEASAMTQGAASAAATAVANVASEPVSASERAVPEVPVSPVPPPMQAPVAAEADSTASSPGLLSHLSPAVLAGVGGLVALIAGGGLYLRSRRKHDGAETSFLESRLQPDSFFGASGGQRVDTRDAASPSSMSYSLSQLDAIGDVDPVAEADVYLAYGRDLQAEEILKEAMRTHPERLAIRTKLMEVYAKRRDTKGVEFLAKDLLEQTQGSGPDWARAQELGMSVDPGNPLYQPGQGQGLAVASSAAAVASVEMDRTLPMSALNADSRAAASAAVPATAPPALDVSQDIDLDISLPPVAETLGRADHLAMQSTSAVMAARSDAASDVSIDFDLPLDQASSPDAAGRGAPAPTVPPLDLSTISLDLDDELPPAKPITAVPVDLEPQPEFVASNPVPLSVVNDPMMRKVELAHEFVQIGDVDGAKDLLQEVLSEGQEVSRAKARELLDKLT